jgi:uncharacterized protein YciI
VEFTVSVEIVTSSGLKLTKSMLCESDTLLFALKLCGSGQGAMNYYVLFYEVVGDYVARRGTFREQHLSLVREAHARGEILLAGAFADPIDKALLVFRSKDASAAELFARNDPYVINGLVKHWEVRAWTVAVGNSNPPEAEVSEPCRCRTRE